MKTKELKFLAFLIFLLSLQPAGILAQGTTSRVVGVVEDQTGAVIPEAMVTLRNEATNVSFTITTTSAGAYVFDSVPVGPYTITVEKQGFKKYLSAGNVLTIGQPMTVNLKLEIGQMAQQVQVNAVAELVQTSTSGNVGNVVDQHTIQELPIVGVRGRNPLNFINFQPGVSVCGNCAGGGVNVNGSRDRAWNFTLDGIDINETSAGGSNFSPLRTNPDSLAEFRVLTSNFTADYGRNSGGEVTMVTRSGSNAFHGDAFEFYQTPRLQANDYNNNLNGLGKPQFVQHIYGFSVGGPIRKNKTFFFTNLQRLATHETRGVTKSVYTAQARQGIFRYVIGGKNAPAGASGASVDPNGNVLVPAASLGTYNIPSNDPQSQGLDPQVQRVLSLTPLPNNFTSGDGLNVAGFSWSPSQSEKQADWTVRIDRVLNDRNTVFARWSHGHQNTLGDSVNDGLAVFPNTPRIVDTERSPRNLAAAWRWIPTPRTTNELVLGMNRFTFNFANPDPNFLSNPVFTLVDVADPLANCVGNLRALTTYQLVDNFTYIRGAHTFKTGINFRYQRHIDRRGSIAAFNAQPLADFDPNVNTVDDAAFRLPSNINTAVDLPRLKRTVNNLLGRVGSMMQGFVASGNQFAPGGSVYTFDARFPEYDFYWQDSWKLRPNLTVDLGLRWEMKLTPRDPRDRLAHPDQPFPVGSPPSNTLKWVKGPLYGDSYRNLGPSFGVAWDPFGTGKTSVRANYRLAYDRINTFSLSSAIFPNLPGQTFGVSNTEFGQAGGRLRSGLPVLSPPAGLTPSQLAQPGPFSTGVITVMDPNWKPPRVHEWSFGIQRQLHSNMVLEVNYIGRHGTNLFGGYDTNQVSILNNGFLDAFNIVRGGGDSPLMNALLQADPNRRAGETGSQEVRRLFLSTLNLGSVAGLASTLGQRSTGGVPVIVLSGFSPFFFFAYPQFTGAFNVLDSNDVSRYNSLQAQLSRRLSTGLTFQFSYTLAKSLDTRSFDPTFSRVSRGFFQSASSTPFDIHNRRLNYAPSDFDVRHSLQGAWVWALPFGAGQRWGSHWGPVLGRVLGGWQSAGVLRATSGRPFTVYSGANTLSNVVQSPANCDSCPADMGALTFDPAVGTVFLFDTNQRGRFSPAAPGQLGRSRNAFRLPRFFNLDLGIEKYTRITEKQNLEFRVEMTNALNHPSFDQPDSAQITSSVFGRERNGVFTTARRIQLALKYYF